MIIQRVKVKSCAKNISSYWKGREATATKNLKKPSDSLFDLVLYFPNGETLMVNRDEITKPFKREIK